MSDHRNKQDRRRPRTPDDEPIRGTSRRHDDDYDHDRRRKRSRSRSEERPRKRRSLTPEETPRRRRSRERDHRDHREHRDRSRRSRSPRPVSRDGDSGRRQPRSHTPDDRNGHHSKSHSHRHRRPSRSPPPTHNGGGGRRPSPHTRSRAPLPSQNDAFTGTDSDYYKDKDGNLVKKEAPNWAPTGRLAAAANTIQTGNQRIILKYHEPAESRKPPPTQPWRMYVFKDSEILETVELHTQSCWLFGREAAVVDVLLEHPSCSKQHAVLQFRYREERGEFGERKGRVKLYVLDLESANGTTVDGKDVGKARYYEVRDGEVLRFGHSEREYVVQLPPREERPKEGT